MRLDRRPTPLARRLHLPRRTIRLRLALLYGGVFFISGAVLLALTYVGVARTQGAYTQVVGVPFVGSVPLRGRPPSSACSVLRHEAHPQHVTVSVVDPNQRNADLRVLAVVSVIALAIMAAVSMGLGWLIAGRVLRPLRSITTAARDISATNLHQRLALDGPDDEFKELGDTFDGLLARLDASFQSQRQFVANASHELRTPLARLKTLVQVALADPNANSESLRAAHERVLASEQQLEGLIEALLDLASSEQGIRSSRTGRPGGGHGRGACGPPSRDRAARPAAERHARPSSRRRQHAAARASRGEPRRQRDPPQHRRRTHRRHDRHHRRHARCCRSPTTARSIPAEELERLQAHSSASAPTRTSQGDGHGLGLSIVHAIATAHEARLSIHTRPEGGLVVEVRFPSSV